MSEEFVPKYISLLSEPYRFFNYLFNRSKMRFENGMFIISIDIDVGNKELGVINEGKNDANVTSLSSFSEYLIGKREEQAIPLFIDLFEDFEIPVTFAIRGQLTEVDDSILKIFLKSTVKHDIGAHGYYHKQFTKLSRNEAENELKMISLGMKKFGINPKSFVFPRNSVAHLDLLEKYKYKCYRGYDDCMNIDKNGQLYNIHPSLFVGQSLSSIFLKQMLGVAIQKKLPFHIWFHLWNFGWEDKYVKKNIKNILVPLLDYAKRKEKSGILTFETMVSAAEKFENCLNP
jgi:peptidoglycan/xylan/chitin deacetylase (PgdA/CDA1 family)